MFHHPEKGTGFACAQEEDIPLVVIMWGVGMHPDGNPVEPIPFCIETVLR